MTRVILIDHILHAAVVEIGGRPLVLELPLLRLLGDYRPSQIPEKPFEPYIDTSMER